MKELKELADRLLKLLIQMWLGFVQWLGSPKTKQKATQIWQAVVNAGKKVAFAIEVVLYLVRKAVSVIVSAVMKFGRKAKGIAQSDKAKAVEKDAEHMLQDAVGKAKKNPKQTAYVLLGCALALVLILSMAGGRKGGLDDQGPITTASVMTEETAEEQQAIEEAPMNMEETQQDVIETPQAMTEAPQAMTEMQQAVAETPQAMTEALQAVTEMPQAITEVPQVGAEAVPPDIIETETQPTMEQDVWMRKMDESFDSPGYGFREGRTWVRSNWQHDKYGNLAGCLIDTDGRIIYAVPSRQEGSEESSYVVWNEFSPVINGTAYYNGYYEDGSTDTYPLSVIIDADGNEVCRFESGSDMAYKIIGRSENHFLVCCVERTATNTEVSIPESKVYLMTVGLDGKQEGEARLLHSTIEQHSALELMPSPVYLGEDIFLIYEVDPYNKRVSATYGFYNAANNTFQRTQSYNYLYRGKFYDGTTIVTDTNGYFLYFVSVDELQEDRANLVLDHRASIKADNVFKHGPVMSEGVYAECIYDQNGRVIPIPEEIWEKVPEEARENDDNIMSLIAVSEDGYSLFSNEYVNIVIGPDKELLYVHANEWIDVNERINNCGGYFVGYDNSNYHYGILDREGVFHSYTEDISVLPDLETLWFGGFGDGYILATLHELGLDDLEDEYDNLMIRSLDGKHLVTTPVGDADTVISGENAGPRFTADLADALPCDGTGKRAEADIEKADTGNADSEADVTSVDEVEAMEGEGIIYAEDFSDVLLFSKDGVRVTMQGIESFFVENKNPDNKKIHVCIGREGYNGVILAKVDDGTGDRFTGDIIDPYINAGETCELGGDFSYKETVMYKFVEYSASLAELPLEEITVWLQVGIGSGEEIVDYVRKVRLLSYNEDDLDPIYGELIAEVDAGSPERFPNGGKVRVYRIGGEKSYVYAVQNLTDKTMDISSPWGYWWWDVNGEAVDTGYMPQKALEIWPGGAELIALPMTESSIRKDRELPSDEPANLGLGVYSDKGFDFWVDLGEM